MFIRRFLLCLIVAAAQLGAQLISIKVGMLLPRNDTLPYTYETSAAAVTLALERVYREAVLPRDVNFTLIWKYEECVEATAAGYAYEMITEDNIDALIAPPCTDGATVSGHVATYFNVPALMWGSTLVSDLADPNPTVINVMPVYSDFSRIICDVMEYFSWNSFSFIYQADDHGGCFSFQRDLEGVTAQRSDCVVSFKDEITTWDPEDINYTISMIRQRSRIVVLCFDDIDQKRSFALSLYDAGLTGEDYVYIFPDTDLLLAGDEGATPFWIDRAVPSDGRNHDAEVIARRGYQASIFAPYLFDLFYLYALSLAKTFNVSGRDPRFYRNGTLISDNSNTEFEGLTGRVVMGTDGVRDSTYVFSEYALNDNSLNEYILFQVVGQNVNITPIVNESAIWATRGGFRPLAVPQCGFDGNGCPVPVFQAYLGLFIAVIAFVSLIIVAAIAVLLYLYHLKSVERRREDELWQVPYSLLSKVSTKNKGAESSRSLQSGPSTTSTKFTFDSVKSSNKFSLYRLEEDLVIARKHPIRRTLTAENMLELRVMRQMDNENVNKFLGLSVDGPDLISVWRFCGRGSIQDVIERGNLNIDAFFIYSLVRDLAEGLAYIHLSPLGCHGRLKSSYCLIDDRWQAKISYHGLTFLRDQTTREAKDLLWTAPEQLRNGDGRGTKAADIYSFAIICSEIVNLRGPWELNDVKGNMEEIVYLVKKGGSRSIRPTLQPAVSDVNQGILHLIRDCWSEDADHRPKADAVRSMLKSFNNGRTVNLMDHVFGILEHHAGLLEEEVEERTKELVEEKKKSDLLLYRMLPRQVAEKLKLGQSVEPESFDCVTIFFSDVVSFTTIASRCSPLQVISLLNEFYTTLDSIIAEYDVYKVETIGDGYLCASGLPRRNGNEHARHIADMSLHFMRSIKNFSIPHLPGERIRLRIGIHTGPCVAGVVGLAMPRYCLFGDTVNTASRMESNGKPDRIHLSSTANHFINNVIGGYVTESRGEVIIKGKGVMETFFLIGKREDPPPPPDADTDSLPDEPL